MAGRTTEQTQWFRFESCWSPPLGTASRPPIRSLPAHPTGVEPRLEPDRNFRLHAAWRSHPKGLGYQGETYKLCTVRLPVLALTSLRHLSRPKSIPSDRGRGRKFPQVMPRPNFPLLHPSDRSRGRNSSASTPRRYFDSVFFFWCLSDHYPCFLSGLRCSLISFVIRHAQRDFLDLCCRNRK